MPITDLTNRPPDTTNLVRFGKIRKGGPKPEQGNKPGRDLDHFRITLEDNIAIMHPSLQKAITNLYGAEPRSLPVVLLGETVDDVFPTWFEAWLASGLQHRCDGVTQKHGVGNAGEYEGNLPCARGEGTDINDPKSFHCGCTRVGKLHVALPQLWNETGMYGKFVLETGSIHDIIELHGRLWAIFDLVAAVQDHPTLMMIPAILGRADRQISYADKNAKSGRKRRSSSLLTLHESIPAMRRTHPQIAARLQKVISASAGEDSAKLTAGEPAGDTPGLTAGDGSPSERMAEWFGKELVGITASTIDKALDGIAPDASRAKKLAAVLTHWYEGDLDAIKQSARNLCGDRVELLNDIAAEFGEATDEA